MGWTEEGKIAVGETTYSFVVYWNEKVEQECVKLYTGDLTEYITRFQSMKEMKEFLNHADPAEINEQIDSLIKFRRFSDVVLDEREKVEGGISGTIDEEEKQKNTKAFMQRMQMICGEMTPKEFAHILGLNDRTVFNLLSGQRTPGGHTFKRIADRTGISADWILGRK